MEVMDAGETVETGDQVVVGAPNGGGIDQLFGGFTPRPWQTRAVLAAIQRLSRPDSEPFVVGGPTGSGKSLTMTALLRWCVQNGGRAALYSNRRLLTNQLITGLQSHGLKIGVRAADFDGHEDASAPIQICSLQTEMSRVFKRRKKAVEDGESEDRARLMYPLEKVDLVLIDEVHMQAAASAEAVIAEYRENGAKVVGFTATPTDLSHIFSELIEAGTVKECLAHKALVPAHVFSCEELDTRHIKPQATGEYSIKEIEKKIWTPQIFGYVWHHWRRLNPHGRQTLGFAPGVSHSVWFAELFSDPANYPQKTEWLARQRESLQWSDAMCEEFMRHGVRAAHIDGADVWVDGKRFKTTPQARADVMGEWKDGKISVVWNRFVLREAIDMPSLYHLILACPIGSVVSYVQVVGRVMRWSKETPDAVLITDHGGNAWRHGSPNEDRDWSKFWHLPSSAMTDERMESMRNKSKPEPITCPRCRAVRRSGTKCWKCIGEGSLVLTARGWIPIENVKVGDSVLTHKNRWRMVEKTHHRCGDAVVVGGHGHPGIVATADHLLKSMNGWCDVATAKKWATPASVEPLPIPADSPQLTPDFCRFVGCWLGDGYVSLLKRKNRKGQMDGRVGIVCEITQQESDRVFEMMANAGLRCRRFKGRTAYNFVMYDINLCRWLKCHFGNYCHDKTIPPWVFGLPVDCRQELLRGYLEADGCALETEWVSSSVSKSLSLGIKVLAQSLGHGCRMYMRRACSGVIEGRSVSCLPQWIIKGSPLRKVKGKQIVRMGDHFYSPIKRRADAGHVNLYDLTVEEDSSYIVEGIVVHNCGYEHQKSSRLVLEVSGELREFMGSTLRPHNVQKRSNTQKLWDDIYFQAYQAHRKLEARVAKLEVEVQANPGLRPTLESSKELLATKLSRAQTFRQAYARFFLDHHYYPPKDLANMPRDPLDWYRKIRDLERSNVRTQAEAVAAAQQSAASAEKPVV